jgi:acyl-CoA thioesterase-1
MRLFLFLALFIPAVSVLSGSFAEAQTKKLVVLGDSLTEGYGVAKDSAFPALLEKKIHESGKKNWTVVNSGISGATTASALGRLKWVFKSKPDLLLLILGANDGLRGLKVEESEKHLSQAIEYAQEQKVTVVLGGLYMPPNYGKDYTEKFKKMYADLASKYKVPLIPFILDKVAGNPKYNLSDGIHPNEAGHKIVAETIYQDIKGML